MKKFFNKKELRISMIFGLIGLVSGLLLGMYQLTILTEELKEQLIGQLGSINVLVPIAGIQAMLYSVITSFFGLKIARKVNLELNFKFDRRAINLAVLIGLITALILSGSDKFIFANDLPLPSEGYRFSIIYFLSSILYGGIVEELMMRLFFMSALVFLFWKIFNKSKDKNAIADWVYVLSILVAAILFALGHLPATIQLLGVSTPIIIRMFLLNGLACVRFGYLY